MKTPKIIYGARVKKWVAVADTDKVNGKRRIVMKCLACGEKIVTGTDAILNGTLRNCNCEHSIPNELPKFQGTACESRVSMRSRCSTGLNIQGFCCYYCPEKDDCLDNCLNTPDRCGCFSENPAKINKHSDIPEEKEQSGHLMNYINDEWRGGV